MNKKFKKICSIILGLAITATSAISMSLSADCLAIIYPFRDLSDFTVVDDSAMNPGDDGGKLLYKNGYFYKADPIYALVRFILSEDVNYEEVNDRVIEIFKEFYPENNLGVTYNGTSSADYAEYAESYKPNLWSETIDGVTIYTLCASEKSARSLNDEKVAAARKCSKDFMKKLNEEKLISKFYDFGEVYFISISHNDLIYSQNDIDLINNYIKENNIDCTLVKDSDDIYKLQSNDNDKLKAFLTAVDIYKVTSIRMAPFLFDELSGLSAEAYGKNSLEELWSIGDANGDDAVTIKDCLFIARKLANRESAKLPDSADYNKDGKKNIKDAAAIAIDIANRKIG